MSTTGTPGTIVIQSTPAATIVQVNAKVLDETTVTQLARAIDTAGAEPATSTLLVIDLSRVEFLPSLCLGALVQIANKCRAREQKVKLASLRPQIRKTFTITRLDRVFELVDSVENAVG